MLSKLDTKYVRDVSVLGHCFTDDGYNLIEIKTALAYFKELVRVCEIECDLEKVTDLVHNDIKGFKSYLAANDSRLKAIEKFLEMYITKYESGFNYGNLINFGITEEDLSHVAFMYNVKQGTLTLTSQLLICLKSINTLTAKCKGVSIITRKQNGYAHVPMAFSKIHDSYGLQLSRVIVEELVMATSSISARFAGDGCSFSTQNLLVPEVNWSDVGNKVVEEMELKRDLIAFDKPSYSSAVRVLSILDRIFGILEDYVQNIINYVRDGYLVESREYNKYDCEKRQQIIQPLDLESIIGHIKIVRSEIDYINKTMLTSNYQGNNILLPIKEHIGCTFGRMLVVLSSVGREFEKLDVNFDAINSDVADSPDVSLRAIEGYLKYFCGMDNSDVVIAEFLRRHKYRITDSDLKEFVDSLEVDDEHKEYMNSICIINMRYVIEN